MFEEGPRPELWLFPTKLKVMLANINIIKFPLDRRLGQQGVLAYLQPDQQQPLIGSSSLAALPRHEDIMFLLGNLFLGVDTLNWNAASAAKMYVSGLQFRCRDCSPGTYIFAANAAFQFRPTGVPGCELDASQPWSSDALCATLAREAPVIGGIVLTSHSLRRGVAQDMEAWGRVCVHFSSSCSYSLAEAPAS